MPQYSASRPHILGLDIVRAIAILLVLFSHTANWYLGANQSTDYIAAVIGHIGVEGFFSLSGFLIGGILTRAVARSSTGRLTMPALAQFWVRRWMRTLPAYWLVVVALCWYFDVWDWRSIAFQQNWFSRTQWVPLSPHTWSLVLEEWFYFLVPLFIFGVGLSPRCRVLAIPLVCAAIFLGCTAARAWSVIYPSQFWGPNQDINPVLRLDCATWGVLAAWINHRWPQAVSRLIALALAVMGSGMLIALAVVAVLTFTPERLIPWGYTHWLNIWLIGHDSALDIASICVIVGLNRLVRKAEGWVAAGVGILAGMSYALYLVHVPVIFLARFAGIDDTTSWISRLKIVSLVTVVSAMIRWGVELPILRLRDRFTPDRPTPNPHLALPQSYRHDAPS